MEGINIKTAKLALEADGNIIGDSFIVQPEKDLAKKLGVLFGIIEIYNINDTFIDGFLEAINDLKTEYYLPPHNLERGIEKRFEEALARANRRIQNALTQSIEEVDCRNISAVLGVIFENKIYISSTGRIKGLFSRRKKSSELMLFDILAGSQEKAFKPESEKIFANILSGELSEKDALIFINEEFLGYFAQNDLADITLSNPPTEALKIIDTTLKEKIAKKNFYAVALRPDILVESTALEQIESQRQTKISEPATSADAPLPLRHSPAPTMPPTPLPPTRVETQTLNHKVDQAVVRNIKPQQSIDHLIYTQVKTEKYLTPSLMPNWQKILIIIWGGLKKFTGATIIQTKKFSLGLASVIKARAAKIKIKPAAQPTITLNNSTPTVNPAPITISESIEATINENIAALDDHNYDQDTLQASSTEVLVDEAANLSPSISDQSLTDHINRWLNRQIVIFLNFRRTQKIAIVAALVLLFVFSQSIVMIGRSTDQASGTGSGYDQIAKNIETQLNTAEAQNIFNDEAGALAAIKKAKELLATIPTKRSTNSLKQQLTDKINTTSYTLQRITYIADPKLLADFNKSQNLSELVGMARTAKVFWVFDNANRNLLRVDTLTDKLELRTSSLPTIKKLTAIDDKSLLLQAKSGDYYKYDVAKNSATKISKPAKEYFLLKNPTTISPLVDPPLASSTIAMSSEVDNYNWFLDGQLGKLIVFDKAGVLKKQYAANQFVSSSAFAAQYKEKKAWIFKAGKIYQIDLDF